MIHRGYNSHYPPAGDAGGHAPDQSSKEALTLVGRVDTMGIAAAPSGKWASDPKPVQVVADIPIVMVSSGRSHIFGPQIPTAAAEHA